MKIRLALMMLVVCCSVAAYAGSIDFEVPGAPCNFSNASPLTNFYSVLGVNFTSGNGAVLNQCANYPVNAHSGTDFLAFNSIATNKDASVPSTPEVITFDAAISNVSIWVAAVGDFSLSDNNGNSTHVSGNGDWVLLSLNDTNISSVTLNGPSSFVADDLSWQGNADPPPTSTVPEPSSLILLGSGIFGSVGVLRRQFRS